MRWRVITAVAGTIAMLAGCGPHPSAPPQSYDRPPREFSPGFEGAPHLPPPDLTDDGPGSLVQAEPVVFQHTFEDANASVMKIVYRSTSGLGGPITQVSGLVAVPPGQPPAGGWPIVSFGHEMTGILAKCAPTRADNFLGYASAITSMVSHGYIVALSDYQGLGVEGATHSVIDATTLGNNLIDAARAARRVAPSASTHWAAFGIGEGGLAAWSAAERAGVYGGGMDLVGAVAIAPYADMTPYADAAAAGILSQAEQYRLQILMLQSLANMDPGFDLNAYRSGQALDQWGLLTDCQPRDPEAVRRLLSGLTPDELRPRDGAALADLRRRLAENALPAKYPTPGSAPVLVVFGTEDPLVPTKGVQQAVSAACAKGDRLEIMKLMGYAAPTNDQTIQDTLAWLQARFGGQRLGDVCVGAT